MKIFDVIIIGGGPAGLSAALVLGRCRRSVIVFDTGRPRNRHSRALHNYITRDGVLPSDFLQLANKEAKKYGVKILQSEIVDARKVENFFILRDKKGFQFRSKKILLATGLRDLLPAIPGIEEYYGKSVFHCPYCDAWELSDKEIGVYSKKKAGLELALALKTWSPNISLFTDGKKYLNENQLELLKRKKIKLFTSRINALDGAKGKLKNIFLNDGRKIPCDGLFFVNGYEQQSRLAEQLDCQLSRNLLVQSNRLGQTNIPGVYVAGDSSIDVQFVVVAAAEGAKAAVSINKELQKEELFRK